MRLRPLLMAGVVIAATQVVVACGEIAEQDLCTQYADLVSAADECRSRTR